MSTTITQADLEMQFTAERVAEVFSVQSSDGSTTGTADAAVLAWAISKARAEVDELLLGVQTPEQLALVHESLVEIAGVITMYKGCARRQDSRNTKPDAIPYRLDYLDARKRLEALRVAHTRLTAPTAPANVGGDLQVNIVDGSGNAYTFAYDPATGSGGFQSGGF